VSNDFVSVLCNCVAGCSKIVITYLWCCTTFVVLGIHFLVYISPGYMIQKSPHDGVHWLCQVLSQVQCSTVLVGAWHVDLPNASKTRPNAHGFIFTQRGSWTKWRVHSLNLVMRFVTSA
jgi:hypothetical protein